MIEIDMPKLEVVENDDFYAKVVCEPLEKGFGLTIGNCLRRILLSALPGAAVKGIRFLDGSVKHEFSAVAGVKEDVTEIILNLKTLAIKTKIIEKDYEKVLHICKEGPAVLTGADLNVDAEIEVINADQYICTIDEGSTIDVEITIGRGVKSIGAFIPENSPNLTAIKFRGTKEAWEAIAFANIDSFAQITIIFESEDACNQDECYRKRLRKSIAHL